MRIISLFIKKNSRYHIMSEKEPAKRDRDKRYPQGSHPPYNNHAIIHTRNHEVISLTNHVVTLRSEIILRECYNV